MNCWEINIWEKGAIAAEDASQRVAVCVINGPNICFV